MILPNLRVDARPREARQRRRWSVHVAGLALGIALLLVPQARGVELRLTLDNDFLTKNALEDDLYTAAFGLRVLEGRHELLFSESTFTDSTNRIRFDETYFSFGTPLRRVGPWNSFVELGLVHVGRGLLGQEAQNAFHRLIGDTEVDLPYVTSSHLHPTLKLQLLRELAPARRLSLMAKGEIYKAFDFKEHAIVSLTVLCDISVPLSLEAEVGARFSSTEYEPLKTWVRGSGLMWEVAVRLPTNVSFAWNYNQFGTKNQHFRIDYHWRVGKRGAGQRTG